MRLSLPLTVLLGFAVAAQQPQFKSGVQLLTIEASVRDRSGNAVADLTPSDFTVTLDGKPRTVVFAHFFHAEPSTIVSSGDATIGKYVSNLDSPATGHVVVFAVDRAALPPGSERAVLASAAGMIDRLSPADSAGLAEIPGRVFDVTRDHARIEEVLTSIVGSPQPRTSPRNVTWDEAKGFERGDKRVIDPVMARECGIGDSFCAIEVSQRWREVLAVERAHAQTLLAGLTSVIRQLGPIRGPKHLVLISAGLPFDPEFLDRFKLFEHAAAEARVTVHTIRMHEFVADASSDAKGGIAFNDVAVHAGMDTLAAMTGGRAYAPAGSGTGMYARIISDVTSFYQLGVESVPGDANGKLHDVKVHVNRPDVETVARPSVAAPPPTPPSGLLDAALKQPNDVGAVPIAVATYSMFGASGVHRLVLAAEIGAPGSSAPAEWGVVVLKDGKPIASTRGRIPTGPERPQVVRTNMELPPGSYRARVGAVDADGSTGTLEIPFTVGGRETSSGARIGDLMLGVTTGKELEPRSRLADSDEFTALVQSVNAGANAPGGTLQFIRGGTATAAATVPFTAVGTPDGTAMLQANVDAGLLSPGRYTAMATIRSGDQVLARVSRIVEVIPGATAAPSVGAAPRPSLPETSAPLRNDAPAADAMKRVGSYVEGYGEAASVLVGVERYSQSVLLRFGMAERTVRALTSEIALVRNSAAIGGWVAFRDVIEVDKKPVSDRRDRLLALFDEKTPDIETAKRINDESARFNVGSVKRTFNVPTAALFFFTPANLRRFAFKRRAAERLGDVEALVVDFHETAQPTIVMTGEGKDIPVSGTLWIDPADGHVLRTRLVLTGYAGAASSATVQVTYTRHDEFDMWVPATMHEEYVTRTGRITGDAEYVDFHRFQTSVKIKK